MAGLLAWTADVVGKQRAWFIRLRPFDPIHLHSSSTKICQRTGSKIYALGSLPLTSPNASLTSTLILSLPTPLSLFNWTLTPPPNNRLNNKKKISFLQLFLIWVFDSLLWFLIELHIFRIQWVFCFLIRGLHCLENKDFLSSGF